MTNVTTSAFPLLYTGASSITTTAKTTYTSSSMPGAWLYSSFGSIPIYNSISDLSANQYKFNNATAYIRVLTGYKVIYYTTNNFGGTATTVDSTNNSYQLFTTVSNIVSVRLYYQGIEVKNNNIPINIPYSITNSNSSNMLDKTGLLYYYPFDTDIVNYSSASDGNNYELSSATLSTSTTKLTSGSLAIPSGGHFKVPPHKINTSGYSIAFWYKLGSVSAITQWARIIELGYGLNTSNSMLIGYPTAGNGEIRFNTRNVDGFQYNPNYTMDTNWHHICVTCSIGGYWTLYIDSVELSIPNNKCMPITYPINSWYINKSIFTNDGTASCNVNQLLIFSRELKPYEIYYLYQNPTTVQLGYMKSQITNSSLQYYYPLTGNFNDISNSTFIEGGIDNGVYTGITALDTITKMTTSSLKITSTTAFFQVPSHYIPINYSIAFWVKMNAFSSGTWSRLIDFSSAKDGGAIGGPLLYFAGANSGSLGFSPSVASTNYYELYTMDFNWHHITITYNGSNSTWILYVDGVVKHTSVYTAATTFLNYCYIGKSNWALDALSPTNCNVNQFAVFSKTLSINEVQDLSNNPTRPITLSNLMYYYPFDKDFFDYSKTTYANVGTDNSTHTNVNINRGEGINNGIYTGITSLDTTTKKMTTSSIKIDSSTGFFQVPSHYITPNYSIAFWYKLNAYPINTTGNFARILEFTPDSTLSGCILLYFTTTNSGAVGIVVNGNNDSGNYINYTLDLNWHHICITYSSGNWIVYIDGISYFTRTFTAFTGLLNYCYIGKTQSPSQITNAVCNVNQFAVFSKTLSIDEVKDLSNNPIQPITLSNLMYYYPFDIDFNDYSQLQMTNRSANINTSLGWIQVPSHYINPTGYSISMWYKLNSYQTGIQSRVFDFAPGLEGIPTGSVVLSFPIANSGSLSFNPLRGISATTAIGYTMDLNWHHICVTCTGSTWYIYIDASMCYTVNSTPTTSLLNYCYIGKSTYSTNGNTNCNVKQVAIYQRQLSVDEIRFLYDNPNCPINNNSITNTTLSNYYPCFPGCYLFVNNKTAIPLYTSNSILNFCFQQDGSWWVLPGFKIIIYTASNYGGTSFVIDNTYGFNNMCKMSDNPNTAVSMKLYYKGQQIIDRGTIDTLYYTLDNSIPSIIPYKYLCNNNIDVPVRNNSQTSFPGVWIITGSGSYPIYETTNDLAAIGVNQKDTYYIILPGFKLVTYTSTFLNGTARTYWNDGYSIYRVSPATANQINSVALYFHGQPIVNKRYSNPSNMNFAISTRLVVPSYTGAIMNIRRSSDSETKDFYSDAQQTYLTSGPNNTGQTYADWIGANTGYIKTMYDQSGKLNHCGNTTNSAQPTLSFYNGKYVMQFTRANSTCLNITTPCQPNTVFTHFYNTDVISTGQYVSGIITPTGSDYDLRFNFYNYTTLTIDTTANINLPPKVNESDWYYSGTGNKLSYVNNINSSVLSLNWAILSTSVQTPTWFNNNSKFTRIGTSNYSTTLRGLNGYMTEMICHNTEMSALDMQHYYADQLILTQNALETTNKADYSFNATYYPSQVKGIWNELGMLTKRNISFTYTFNYTGADNSGTFYLSVDDFAWIIINGGAPTVVPYASWTNGIGITGAMPIINGINTIEIIAYNYDVNNPNSLTGQAACFASFFDSNTLIAYTSNQWKTKIVNTIDQTSLFADPIQGGLWVTTYSFTENEGYYSIINGQNTIKTPNYYSNIPNTKPVSGQVISNFSSSSSINPLINANCNLWGFKAVGYFVPNYTGTWTFTMFGDDIAQIWIGVSGTNPTSINQLSTPNASCFNQSKTFDVSVTNNVKYPILIYMGNSQGNNAINPNGFSLTVTNASVTPTLVSLSTVFYYLNCPPTY